MKKLLLLSVLILSRYCFAGPYPIITSLTAIPAPDGYNWTYQFTQGVVDIGPQSDEVVPNGWYVMFGHRHHSPNGVFSFGDENYKPVLNGETYSQAAMRLYDFDKDRTQIHHGGDTVGECVGYVFSPTHDNYNDSKVVYMGGCMDVPPANEWCRITTPELNLDHGSLSQSDAEGSVASTTMNVDCTSNMSVKFKLETNQNYVYLEPTGKAEITIDGKPLNSEITLPQGSSTLVVKDMLSGVTAEGVNSGSSVIVMAPY